jgi:hypothetical protein
MGRQQVRGRMVFPVLRALIDGARRPFPQVAFMPGRCPGCTSSGMGYLVVQERTTGGMSASHDPSCALAAAGS